MTVISSLASDQTTKQNLNFLELLKNVLKYACSTPKINLSFRQTTTTPFGKLPSGYSTVTSTQRYFTSSNHIESPKIIVEISYSDCDNDNVSFSEDEGELSSVAGTRNNVFRLYAFFY